MREQGKSKKVKAKIAEARCKVCRRRLALLSLTIVHDDLGDHELCTPCEEVYSANTMRLFARELAAHGEALAYFTAKLTPAAWTYTEGSL